MKMKNRAEAPIISGSLQHSQPHEDCISLLRPPYNKELLLVTVSTRLERVACPVL